MATTAPHRPAPYKPSWSARIVDGLRYGGGIGQWSWLAHRASGLGILFFLVIHITDTFLVIAFPYTYDHTVALYGGVWFDGKYYWPLRWAFRVGELGLIASVLFHAVNGCGVILYDFWSRGTLYRRTILKVVQFVFWGLMIPATIAVLLPLRHPPEGMEDIQQPLKPSLAARPSPGAPQQVSPSELSK